MDRPITPIDEFERALDKADLTKEEYELIDKHKTLINWYKKKFKLDDYQLLWLVFFKGVSITIIFFKIFEY